MFHNYKSLLTIFIVFFMTSLSFAQFVPEWERCVKTSSKPSWFGSGMNRGLAYGNMGNGNRLYVLNRLSGPAAEIRVLDPSTGVDIVLSTPFDLSSISGGTFIANDIEITSDGILIVGNMASSAFKLYIWTTEGGAPTAYSFILPTVSGIRYGDKITVVGSWAAGTMEVWVPGAGTATTGAVQVLKTTNQGVNWTTTQIDLSGFYKNTVSTAAVAPFSPGGNFYIAGNGANPRQHTNGGVYVSNSLFSGTNSQIAGIKFFTVGEKKYLVTVAYRAAGSTSGNKNTRSYVYDVTTPSSVTDYGSTNLLSDNTTDFGNAVAGDAAIKDNGDGSVTIFVLGTDQGIGAYTTNSGALPVELASFTASAMENKVQLKWNTATEVNNYGFEIERSCTDGDWEKLGFISGHGNSSASIDYSFTDDNVASQKEYKYRLKQIDNDGSFSYSSTATVFIDVVKEFTLSQNFPNPFNPSTVIRFSLPQAANVKLTVFNSVGEEVNTLVSETLEAGTHNVQFNAQGLASGVYFYRLQAGSYVKTMKMQLVK